MRRPPMPIDRDRCPHCGAKVAKELHDTCPVAVMRRIEEARAAKAVGLEGDRDA